MFIIFPLAEQSMFFIVPGHKSTNKTGDKLAELVFIVDEVDGSVWRVLELVVAVVVVVVRAVELSIIKFYFKNIVKKKDFV